MELKPEELEEERNRQILEILMDVRKDLGDIVIHSVYSTYIPSLRYPEEKERELIQSAVKKLKIALALM